MTLTKLREEIQRQHAEALQKRAQSVTHALTKLASSYGGKPKALDAYVQIACHALGVDSSRALVFRPDEIEDQAARDRIMGMWQIDGFAPNFDHKAVMNVIFTLVYYS